jgi:hypothetical protein
MKTQVKGKQGFSFLCAFASQRMKGAYSADSESMFHMEPCVMQGQS